MTPGAVWDKVVPNLNAEPGDSREAPLHLGVQEEVHLVGLDGDGLSHQPLQGGPEGPEGGHGVGRHFPRTQAVFSLPMFGEGKLLRRLVPSSQVLCSSFMGRPARFTDVP